MTRLPTLILFDFDRTIGFLYRDRNVLSDLKVQVLETYAAAAIDPQLVRSLSDDGYHAWHRLHEWAAAHLDAGLAEELNASAERVVSDFEVKRVSETDLIPRAADDVRRIARVVPVGIVSSNSTRAVEAAVTQAGIRDLFGYIGGRETDPFVPSNLKPDPSQLRLAIERLGKPSGRVWYVGDDVIDVIAAHAASMQSVAVATGVHSVPELEAAGADIVVPSLSELAELVERLGP